jgi:hypothetical protein
MRGNCFFDGLRPRGGFWVQLAEFGKNRCLKFGFASAQPADPDLGFLDGRLIAARARSVAGSETDRVS